MVLTELITTTKGGLLAFIYLVSCNEEGLLNKLWYHQMLLLDDKDRRGQFAR